MSNSLDGIAPKKNRGANCVSIGCGTIFGLFILINLANAGAGAVFPFLIIAAFVIFIIVRTRKDKKLEQAASQPTIAQGKMAERLTEYARQADLPMQLPTTPVVAASANSSEAGDYRNPLCNHRFTEAALKAQVVTCECGNQFNSTQLREFNSLHSQLLSIEDRLRAVTAEIRNFASTAPETIDAEQVSPKFEAAAQSAASSTIAEPVRTQAQVPATPVARPAAPVKPAKPKVARPKVNLSLQQWLIIGASVLVMVAGSIFVSYGISQDWPPIVFAAVTVTIALLTAFGAFKLKSISVMLTNFAAIFSSSMVTATLMVLGDNVFTGELDFVWDSAPAWWWAISLLIVSVMATILARAARNFGYKAIAILTSSTAIAVFVLGFLFSTLQLGAELYGLYLAGMSIAAIAILYQGKFLISIAHDEVTNKEFKAYAKQLVERETNSLRAFSLIGAGSLAAIGMSLAIIQAGASILVPANPFALLCVAVVWFLLGMRSDTWSQLLSKAGKPLPAAKTVSSSITLVALSLTLASAATVISEQFTRNLVAVAMIAVVVWFAQKIKPLGASALQSHIAMWAAVAIYTAWTLAASDLLGYGVLLISVSLLLTVYDLRFNTPLYQVAAFAVNGVGVLLLVGHYFATSVIDANSVQYAGTAIAFALASNAHLLIQTLAAKRIKQEVNPIVGWIGFGFAAVVVFVMQSPFSNSFEFGVSLPITIGFLVYAAAAFAISSIFKFGRSNQNLLNLHSYLGQTVTLLAIANAVINGAALDANTITLLLAALAALNYAKGFAARASLQLQVGFVFALVAFFANQFTGGTEPSALQLNLQVILVAVATYLHVTVWRKRLAEVTSKQTTLVVFSAIGAGLAVSFGVFALSFTASASDFLSINLVLSVLALAATALSEFTGKKGKHDSARNLVGVSLIYASVSVLSSAAGFALEDQAAFKLRAILTLVVLAAIVLRQFARTKAPGYALVGYAANLATATLLGSLTQVALNTGNAPEVFSLWLAVGLAATTLLIGKHFENVRTLLLLDVPIVGVALTSLAFGMTLDISTNASILRGLLASLLISAYAYHRSAKIRGLLVAGYAFGAIGAIWLAQGLGTWLAIKFDGIEGQTILVALSVYLGNLVLLRRNKYSSAELRYGVIVGILTLPSLAWALTHDAALLENQLRQILALAAISAFAVLIRKSARNRVVWVGISYLTTIAASLSIAQASYVWLNIVFAGPEIYSLAAAAAVLISYRLLKSDVQNFKAHLTLSVPTAVLAIPTLAYSLDPSFAATDALARRLAALALVAGYTYLMMRRYQVAGWLIAAYAVNAAVLLTVTQLITTNWMPQYSAPELYSVAVAAGILVTNFLGKKLLGQFGQLFKLGIPTAVLTLPSLVFSLTQANELAETQLRRLVALALISTFALYMTKRTERQTNWVIGSYLAVAATAASIANAAYALFAIEFAGPELYALAISAGVVLTRRLTREQLKVHGSLFTWGLPLGILIIPSTLYTFASLQVPFGQLTALEVTRVIAVVAVSAVLLVLGIRRGNLASTAIGLLGLGLVLIPGTAVHSSEVVAGVQVESTALITGVLIFVLLSVLHQRNVIKGTSAIYIGIPVTIALAPALVNSLLALGNPTLESVDWWRFSIVLAAGLTLLIVGALRELAGMFYPGLAAVLLSALPYGFKQTQDQAWFLWVLLLLVAGVMVWVAVRLEQIKKAGRNSTAWLKELK